MPPQLWLDPKWRPRWSATNFLRRHSRFFPIFGAAMVFTLFVIKDAYRESLKEITESLERAKSGFASGTETNQVFEYLKVINRRAQDIQRFIRKKSSESEDKVTEFGVQ